MSKDKDLFGNDVPTVYFKSAPSKNDDGWLMMYCCGSSQVDNKEYVVTTHQLKADEVPSECNDAKAFSELVSDLLNKHYNAPKEKEHPVVEGKTAREMKAKDFLNDYAVDNLDVFGRHEEHYSLDNLMEEYASLVSAKKDAEIKYLQNDNNKILTNNFTLEDKLKAQQTKQKEMSATIDRLQTNILNLQQELEHIKRVHIEVMEGKDREVEALKVKLKKKSHIETIKKLRG